MLTRDEAIIAVRKMLVACDEWANSDGPTTTFRGQPVKQLTTAVQDALGECCGLFLTTDVAVDAQEIVMAVDVVREEAARYFDAARLAPEATRPDGSDELWVSVRILPRLLVASPRRLPTSIPELRRMKAEPETIAKQYGWWKNGRPDVQRVQREIDKPGSEFNLATWAHPRERARAAELAAKWQQRCERVKDLLPAAAVAPTTSRRKREPDPRSLEELCRGNPGMTVEQLARMKMTTTEDIQRQMDEQGISLTPVGVRYTDRRQKYLAEVMQQQADDDKANELRGLELNLHEEAGNDITARILAMALDGVKPKRIAEALTERFNKQLTYNQVTRVIGKIREREHQAESPEAVISQM